MRPTRTRTRTPQLRSNRTPLEEFESTIRVGGERLARLTSGLESQMEQEPLEREMHSAVGHVQAFAEHVDVGLNEADRQTRRAVTFGLLKRVAAEGNQAGDRGRRDLERGAGSSSPTNETCPAFPLSGINAVTLAGRRPR